VLLTWLIHRTFVELDMAAGPFAWVSDVAMLQTFNFPDAKFPVALGMVADDDDVWTQGTEQHCQLCHRPGKAEGSSLLDVLEELEMKLDVAV
jgi:hypothetical protein